MRFRGKNSEQVSYYSLIYSLVGENKMKTKIQEMARKHWLAAITTIIAADVLDELTIPGILLMTGHPVLSGIAILGDIDWLTYPIIFFIIKAATKLFTEVGA